MKKSKSSILYKYCITWWHDCPPVSVSMLNFSNSPKHGQIKKSKMNANGILNSKGSNAGNYFYNENCTHTANLPYYPLLSSRTLSTLKYNFKEFYVMSLSTFQLTVYQHNQECSTMCQYPFNIC